MTPDTAPSPARYPVEPEPVNDPGAAGEVRECPKRVLGESALTANQEDKLAKVMKS